MQKQLKSVGLVFVISTVVGLVGIRIMAVAQNAADKEVQEKKVASYDLACGLMSLIVYPMCAAIIFMGHGATFILVIAKGIRLPGAKFILAILVMFWIAVFTLLDYVILRIQSAMNQ